jgi:hypothetical protein
MEKCELHPKVSFEKFSSSSFRGFAHVPALPCIPHRAVEQPTTTKLVALQIEACQ